MRFSKSKHLRMTFYILLSVIASFEAQAMSAREWLKTCRVILAISPEERQSLAFEKRLILIDCAREAARVWCSEGYVIIGDPLPLSPKKNAQAKAELPSVCPHPLFDSRPVIYALNYWKYRELPIMSGWFSSVTMFSEAFQHRWPSCLPARQRLGVLPPPHYLKGCIDVHVPKWRE